MVLDLWRISEHESGDGSKVDDDGGVEAAVPRFRVALGGHDILAREIALELMKLLHHDIHGNPLRCGLEPLQFEYVSAEELLQDDRTIVNAKEILSSRRSRCKVGSDFGVRSGKWTPLHVAVVNGLTVDVPTS